MRRAIPEMAFRIEPAYEFEGRLEAPEVDADNILVGQLPGTQRRDCVFMGKVAEHQASRKNVWIDTEGAHAVYVMGKRRSGKTYTLGVLAEGLTSETWIKQGERKHPVLILDTVNVFSTMHHRVESVYGEGSSQVGELSRWQLPGEQLNILFVYPRGCERPAEGVSCEIAIRPEDLSAEDWAGLFEVDTFSDPIGQLLSELYEKVALEGYTDNHQARIEPNPQYAIDDLLACLDKSSDIQRYEPRTIEAVRRRLNAVRRLPIFSAKTTQIEEIFRRGQVSILLLRDIDQSLRALLVGTLVKKLMERRSVADKFERLAAIQLALHDSLREKDPGRAGAARQKYEHYLEQAKKGVPGGWVIIDEAHNYLPTRGITASSAPLRKYVNEGRNLGLSIVVATQTPSALDASIRRNADILIIHAMSMRDDISTAEGMLNAMFPDEFRLGRAKVTSRAFEHLVRSLPLGYAVVSNDRVNRVFVAKTRPRMTVHGGVEY